ncbi:MAG: GNAT family N-acetyltransferase [Candidatus Saccharimonadales bacterium]
MSEQNNQIELSKPTIAELPVTVQALCDWQQDGDIVQLHPGDLGWYGRMGTEDTIEAIRTWKRNDQTVAIGLLDGRDLLRIAIDPTVTEDPALADRMAEDSTNPENGVLPEGAATVEARSGSLLKDRLIAHGWEKGEPWTSLKRDLSEPVEDSGLRIEVVTSDQTQDRVAVQQASFDNSTFTEEKWHAMAAGLPYKEARCLVGYDEDNPVAIATVWSAGVGKPGLIEPLGVDNNHRRKGYGRAITLAAAGALREMGSSSATVCTDSVNVGAVATYKSAGFEELPDIEDLTRRR